MTGAGKALSGGREVADTHGEPMNIENGLQAQVACQFIARRESMLEELASRAKTPAGERGAPPAASLGGDEVRLSPEARAAAWQLRLVEPGGYPGLPAPDEVVAALRAVFEAPPGTDLHEPLAALRTLLARLATGFPGGFPGAGTTQSLPAAELVRLLLGEPGGGLPPGVARFDAEAAASALRALLSQAGAGGPSTAVPAFERAAAALLAAVLSWRERAAGPAFPGFATHTPGNLPAALLSLASEPPRRPRRRGVAASHGERDETDQPPDKEDDEPYRSSPRRT